MTVVSPLIRLIDASGRLTPEGVRLLQEFLARYAGIDNRVEVLESAGGGAGGVVTITANGIETVQTVSAPGALPSMRLIAALAPTTPDDENEAEMLDVASLAAVAGTDQVTITATWGGPTSGPVKIVWGAV